MSDFKVEYCKYLIKNRCIYKICTMLKLGKYKEFEWDRGNIDKSYKKRGINPNEAEEVFLDEKFTYWDMGF